MQQSRAGLALVRGAALLLLSLQLTGCISIRLFDGGTGPLVETVLSGEEGPKILLLDIDGAISDSVPSRGLLGLPGENMVARIREELDKARLDDEVRGILLRVNSPGGTATASDIIYGELRRFKRERGIPVVAQLMGVAASGGYYVAMAADRVVAQPTTVTGSIGVIFVGVNFSGLMEKLGLEDQTLTAGSFKDAGSFLRPMRPEERRQLQSVLDDMHARFKSVVEEGRSELESSQVASLADGRIYSAPQALELGLVDVLGGLDDAVAEVERLGGLSKSRVVSYQRSRRWVRNYYAQAPAVPSEVRIRLGGPLGELLQGPGFFYLWAPGLAR